MSSGRCARAGNAAATPGPREGAGGSRRGGKVWAAGGAGWDVGAPLVAAVHGAAARWLQRRRPSALEAPSPAGDGAQPPYAAAPS